MYSEKSQKGLTYLLVKNYDAEKGYISAIGKINNQQVLKGQGQTTWEIASKGRKPKSGYAQAVDEA